MPNPKPFGQIIGWLPPRGGGGLGNFSLNAAANWLGFSFIPESNQTVSAVAVVFRALTGTLAATDVSATIYTDNGNQPGAALSAATTTVSPTLTAGNVGTFVTFSGFSQAVTAGTMYWVVLKNLNATPAANFPNWRFAVTGAPNWPTRRFSQAQTTNSGGAWTVVPGQTLVRVDYQDGSSDGVPILLVSSSQVGLEVFGSNELGNVFTLPATVALNVRGVVAALMKVGSPPGNLRYQVYSGTTLLGTTRVVPANRIPTAPNANGDWITAYFSSPIVLPPGAIVRMTVGTDSGGDASNYYGPLISTIDPTAASEALFPFATAANLGGQMMQTYFNGSSWVQTASSITQMALILESEAEFAVPWPRANVIGAYL